MSTDEGTIAERAASAFTARPPFNDLVAGTSGRILVTKSPTQVVLPLTDLSTIAAVHDLRILVMFAGNLGTSEGLPMMELTGWDITWKPAEPERPWGVFA
ncbi:hypothetical protein SEA_VALENTINIPUFF_51 [Microbacterium phage ValentiniPuff]|uniref:Uncharacterized protein n=1 Tax=Microbacterium phage ValentiniPuff TaxID=2315705 RepID=A0A386KQ42_9CAUD|nr:hypothetical protein SEA_VALENTINIPUFF_51 [Microbacterium phage ValentiniPuff]